MKSLQKRRGGVFELSDLAFADGEETVRLTLTLTETEPGAEYSCTLTIDSEYAATDGSATELTITFTIEPEPEPEPEPDYSITVSNVSVLPSEEDPEYISAAVTLGEDVEYAVVALVAGTEYDAASVEAEETLTETGTVELALPEESGTYSVVAVAYADGEVKGSDSASLTYTAPEPAGPEIEVPDGWTLLGMAEYTDDFINGINAYANIGAIGPYDVPILEKDDTPGLFRLVNPYGEYYPLNEPGDWDDTQTYYIEINATDAEGVYIEKQDTGMDWGNGHIYVRSRGDEYMKDFGDSFSTIKSENAVGFYADGVITFPDSKTTFNENQLLVYEGSGTGQGANRYNAFKIVLPSAR